MRHIFFCAAMCAVVMLGSASFAAQSYVSPDLRYPLISATQFADSGVAADSRIIKCSYDSPSTSKGCVTGCAVGCDTGGGDACGIDCDCGYGGGLYGITNPCRIWSIDYRIRRFADSNTSYEFGTPDGAYTPLSKLDWNLDSTWHGLQVGMQSCDWGIHFEWLTPMGSQIDGPMTDYDWIPKDNLISMTESSQRWNEGHIIDLGAEYKLAEGLIEIWPMVGFRFQRFDITASGLNYIVPAGTAPLPASVDAITFNQQYYQFYLGGQLRKTFCVMGTPVDLIFQGDWAETWGYNIDHHLLRAGGDRYTKENTNGGSFHLGLTAEAPLTKRLSLGCQLDHMQIRTTGTHHMDWPSQGLDMKWTNGVLVKSMQTSITAYLRACF